MMGRGCKAEWISPWWGAAVRPKEYHREGRSAHKSSNTASKWQSTGFEPGKWQPRALTKDNVLNNASRHANRLPLRAKPRKHCREAWIAVRQKEIDSCRAAKKKLISLWGVNCRQAKRNRFLPWGKEKIDIAVRRELPSGGKKSILALRQRKIDIAVRRESPSGGKKSIFAVRQRKNWYRREVWIAVRRKKLILAVRERKIDMAVRRESPSGGKKWILAVRQRKIDYCREAKKNWLSPRGKEKLISRRWKNRLRGDEKNRLRGDEKIDCVAMKKIYIAAKEKAAVAESSYRTLEHHLRGEQKRKLCLLDNYLRNSPKL
jgi:hypothetical protein